MVKDGCSWIINVMPVVGLDMPAKNWMLRCSESLRKGLEIAFLIWRKSLTGFVSPLLPEDMGVQSPSQGAPALFLSIFCYESGQCHSEHHCGLSCGFENMFSRIDAGTLPATLPQWSTIFQYRVILSTCSGLPSAPPSLETSLPALITDLSKLGTTTWIKETEVIVSTTRCQVLLNTNVTGVFGGKGNLLLTLIRDSKSPIAIAASHLSHLSSRIYPPSEEKPSHTLDPALQSTSGFQTLVCIRM